MRAEQKGHVRGGGLLALVGTALCTVLLLSTRAFAEYPVYYPRTASIVIEAASGRVLEQHNADALRYPASLTKLMTLYLLFQALQDHRVSLNQELPVSERASAVEPVKLGLRPGSHITVENAILGMVTLSANDAATVVGQYLGGGSDARFAQLMTLHAHAMGLRNTEFRNASGLPNSAQVTTARDIAMLARRLILDFPQYYHYFSVRNFVYNGTRYYNDDDLLEFYPGDDGMKTGYTNAAGHNLVSSAVQDGIRLIGVVLDTPSNIVRDRDMVALLNDGFAKVTAVASARPDAVPARETLTDATRPPVVHRPRVSPAVAIHRIARTDDLTANWGLNLGNFPSPAAARKIAFFALYKAKGGIAHIEPLTVDHRRTWHASVAGVTATQAFRACNALIRVRTTCDPLRPSMAEMAER